MAQLFGHEKLKVYQKGLGFAARRKALLDSLPRRVAACDHLDRPEHGRGQWPFHRNRSGQVPWYRVQGDGAVRVAVRLGRRRRLLSGPFAGGGGT